MDPSQPESSPRRQCPLARLVAELALTGDAGLTLIAYTADAGSPSQHALDDLAGRAAAAAGAVSPG